MPPRGLRELLGDDVPAEELERLRATDELLRRVPAPPPHVPESLTRAVRDEVERPARVSFGRTARVLALAATLALAAAAGSLALSRALGDDDALEVRRTVALEPTAAADGANGTIALGARDGDGNWRMRVHVAGLPELPPGAYYLLWLEKDGEYGGTCGSFAVGPDGEATVELNASYRLADYDAFVVTAELPGEDDEPHLLEAPIPSA